MAWRSFAAVLLVGLSGCSNGASPDAEFVPDASATGHVTSTDPMVPPPAVPAPREVHNATYRFPDPTGQPFQASFEVPANAMVLRISMWTFGDCPVTVGFDSPAVVFTAPGGTEFVMDDLGGNSGHSFTTRCDPPSTSPQDYGESVGQRDAEQGTWTFASRGWFSGEVRLVVTTDPQG
jgi:hypothetical protein